MLSIHKDKYVRVAFPSVYLLIKKPFSQSLEWRSFFSHLLFEWHKINFSSLDLFNQGKAYNSSRLIFLIGLIRLTHIDGWNFVYDKTSQESNNQDQSDGQGPFQGFASMETLDSDLWDPVGVISSLSDELVEVIVWIL